ncbi:MAG: L-rhamnose isomerase [Spirochaeta sp.]|jgi:L-rhamnose isomerase|nr:L-rhamnose isomerase [Spirochaeta sp.]
MHTEAAYSDAREHYQTLGVDTEEALKRLGEIPISINCWQADDVGGFEGVGEITGGGIMATGGYPGKARNPDELRKDFEFAYSLIPGRHRFNLHASYLEHGGKKIDRDAVAPEHFTGWVEWARSLGVPLDFNPTFFSHPLADAGFTLASKDEKIRSFWIEHGKRTREIAAYFGRETGSASLNNFWVPDGYKDEPADRLGHREILIRSLDEIFSKAYPETETIDAVESKLFGIGSESYVVGSHDFYLAYALSRGKLLTMDAGHYHPTESVAEKITAILPFTGRLMLHVSRPVRWDSDHVVIMDDATKAIFREIKRADAFERIYVAVDFFDASINRLAAWVIGIRSSQKAALAALLEPTATLRAAEESGDFTTRLALQEEMRTMPLGAVWDEFCRRNDAPIGPVWIERVKEYEKTVLDARS